MLRQLSSDFFARSPLLVFPVIALGIFFTVFVAVSLRAIFARREDLDRAAALPLSETEVARHV